MDREVIHRKTLALAGNPNVGKSTLFNVLTGMHQHTGNWPGKTVEVASGKFIRGNTEYQIVDLPGTYSLNGKSEEEQLASEFLSHSQVDCTVIVCDGSCLERSLILALQLLQRCSKSIVCVNLMDEATQNGIIVDSAMLSQLLQAPVILMSAGKKEGMDELLTQIEVMVEMPLQPVKRFWENPIVAAQKIVQNCVHVAQDSRQDFHRKVDKLLVSRRFGLPLMLLILLGIIWLTVWGANFPSMVLEAGADCLYNLLQRCLHWAPWWLKGVLLDGLYATTARVICVMLPPMAIFFPLFTILEEIGYLPRMAFLLDPCMARCGGCGKQALTLCMGLGCNAVGVMGCRIIDSPRERLAAILTNAMVPCNGRFPTLILLGSIFFPEAGAALVVAACVALGAAGAVSLSGVLSKTVLHSKPSSFVLEMPPFRRPRLGKTLLRSLLDRTLFVAGRAISVAAPAGVILWILANTGLLQWLAACFEPAGRLLGMNGGILLAFVLAVPANELLIPIIIMAVTGGSSLQDTTQLGVEAVLAGSLTWQMAVCTMVFTIFHWPCSTTLLTIYRETGSVRKTAAALALPALIGTLLCCMLNLVFLELI